MKKRRIISNLLTALGLAAAVGTIWIVALALRAEPVMLLQPDGAADRAGDLMHAVCTGDYETASGMLYGRPSMGTCPEDSSPSVNLLWAAFQDSLEFDFAGDCYATDTGLAIDVNIRSLNILSVMEGLDSRAEILLNQRIAAAESSAEIYDEDHNFRAELIEEVLQEATQQALEENKQYQTQTIPLHLVYDGGQWWVMPDSDLMNVLSGSVPG